MLYYVYPFLNILSFNIVSSVSFSVFVFLWRPVAVHLSFLPPLIRASALSEPCSRQSQYLRLGSDSRLYMLRSTQFRGGSV